jgi:hypothetical protein
MAVPPGKCPPGVEADHRRFTSPIRHERVAGGVAVTTTGHRRAAGSGDWAPPRPPRPPRDADLRPCRTTLDALWSPAAAAIDGRRWARRPRSRPQVRDGASVITATGIRTHTATGRRCSGGAVRLRRRHVHSHFVYGPEALDPVPTLLGRVVGVRGRPRPSVCPGQAPVRSSGNRCGPLGTPSFGHHRGTTLRPSDQRAAPRRGGTTTGLLAGQDGDGPG